MSTAVPSLPPILTPQERPQLVDCRGMCCPAPLLATAKAAKGLGGRGGRLVVVADDPAFPLDVKSWCRSTGHALLDLRVRKDGLHQATVEVDASAKPRAERRKPASPPPSSRRPREVAPSSRRPVEAQTEVPGTTARQRLDCRGMTCPQPIVTVARAMKKATAGSLMEVIADDPAFPMDISAWCRSAEVELVAFDDVRPPYRACLRVPGPMHPAPPSPRAPFSSSVRPRAAAAAAPPPLLEAPAEYDLMPFEGSVETPPSPEPSRAIVPANDRRCSLLVLHNDHEALLAALLVANGAAAAGMDVSIFFTFWGLNLLRGERPNPEQPKEKVSFIQRLFKWLMPRGAKQQKLGQMNFGGAGKGMLNAIMRSQDLMMLPELLDSAEEAEVRFIACTMSMGVMGITKRDLRPLNNLEYGGVAAFIERSHGAAIHLVF